MSRRLVAFTAAGQEYALPLERVHEVVPWQEPRSLGAAEPWLLGVVNLRGRLLQVADLSLRIGGEPGERRTIVVFESPQGPAGLAVEDVDRVVDVEEDQLSAAPPASGEVVAGIAVLGPRLVIVLDADALLGPKPPPRPPQRRRSPARTRRTPPR